MKKRKAMKRVLVFFGMTATGKSFVARTYAEKWQCHYFNSDIIRKELAGRISEDSVKTALNEGIYASVFTRKTYDELLHRAELALLKDETKCVVLDASYKSRTERGLVRDRLKNVGNVFFIYCTCPEAVVRERLVQRAKDPHAVSEGRWEVYLEQKRSFDMPSELGDQFFFTLETDKNLPELLKLVEERMHDMGECEESVFLKPEKGKK